METPGEAIAHHSERLAELDEAELGELLLGFDALADEGAGAWTEQPEWSRLWWLLAAAETVGERRWKHLVELVYLKAAYGEIRGWMQSIRHGPERAFKGDYSSFAELLESLSTHERRGTRYWAIRELGILRERSSLQPLVAAVAEQDPRIRKEAIDSLHMLAQEHPEARSVLEEMGL